MAKLNKIEWLEKVVNHAKVCGFDGFITYINDEETAVMLRGFKPGSDETHDMVLQRVRKHKNDGDGLSAVYNRRYRLRRWAGQYDHWLSYVIINGGK